MQKETTNTGVSDKTGKPAMQKAFPDPADMPQPVDIEEGNGENTGEPQLSERDQVLAGIEAKVDKMREEEINSSNREYYADTGEDEAAAKPAEQETPSENNTNLPEGMRADPLADFIVIDEANDTPMFMTRVDGVDKYIPLDRARQQLQKHESAESRLQLASERNKQLDEREIQIRSQEEALKTRAQQQESPPSALPVQDVSDQDFTEESQQLVNSIFTGTPDEAAETMAKVLKSVRGQATAPQNIDPTAIVAQAAELTRQQMAGEAAELDITEGFKTFQKDFSDIADDPQLFRYADNLTEDIQSEWQNEGRPFKTSEVMSEAGRRTREWVQSMKSPSQDATSLPQKTDRNDRKRNLRPMPSSQSHRTHAPEETGELSQTPQDAVNAMRKARGQAY